jgi:hypothetical protein
MKRGRPVNCCARCAKYFECPLRPCQPDTMRRCRAWKKCPNGECKIMPVSTTK